MFYQSAGKELLKIMMELPTASNANLEVTKTKKDKLIVNSALLDNIKTKKDKMLAANVLLDNIKTKKDKPGAAHAMDLLIWLANVSVSGCGSCGCSSPDRKSSCACKHSITGRASLSSEW